MNTDLARVPDVFPAVFPDDAPKRGYSLAEMIQIAELLAKSGFFKDIRDGAQAFAKILRGSELGIGPATALAEIDVIQGKTVLSSALMARLVKSSGKYDYRVIEATATACELEWFQFGKPIGNTRWTLQQAEAAGLAGKDIYKGYAEDMLFWRALSRGAKRFCADVFGGAVYAQGEIEMEERPALPPSRPVHIDEISGEIREAPPAARPALSPAVHLPVPEDQAYVCATATCQAPLTVGQSRVSIKGFGKPLCTQCQHTAVRLHPPAQPTSAIHQASERAKAAESLRESLIRRYGESKARAKHLEIKVEPLTRDMMEQEIQELLDVLEATIGEVEAKQETETTG